MNSIGFIGKIIGILMQNITLIGMVEILLP